MSICENFKTFSPKETREIAEKRGKIPKNALYFLTRYCHGSDLQAINNNTYNCENVTNLAGEFPEHKSQGGNTRIPLSTLVQYSYP